jgi:CheY-like chemotaxis protein
MSFVTLVVEDDVLQRVLLADLLKERGQEVVECTTAEAAEIVLATIGLELRALITDVQLEGRMSGIELAEFAKSRFPHLKVLIVSGREQPLLPPDTRFFPKPYKPDEVVTAALN